MSLYIFILHHGGETADQRIELEFDNDRDALETAKNVADLCEIDVWKGDILLAQVKKAKAPIRDASYT